MREQPGPFEPFSCFLNLLPAAIRLHDGALEPNSLTEICHPVAAMSGSQNSIAVVLVAFSTLRPLGGSHSCEHTALLVAATMVFISDCSLLSQCVVTSISKGVQCGRLSSVAVGADVFSVSHFVPRSSM